MDSGLDIEAINHDTEPQKLMNCLLDAKTKFFTVARIIISPEVDINISEKKLLSAILGSVVVGDYDWNDFDYNHRECKQDQIIFVLKEFENPCFASRRINLVCVNQSETA